MIAWQKWAKRLLWGGLVLYLIGAMLPLSSLWYKPGNLVVLDSIEGVSPRFEFWRHIKRPTLIRYSVVVRRAGEAETACEGGREFRYEPAEGALIDKDLAWWVGGPQCDDLKAGLYWMQTCWTATQPLRSLLPPPLKEPLGWLLPPKTKCLPTSSEHHAGYSFEIRSTARLDIEDSE